MQQQTIEKSVHCSGVGLHSGGRVALSFHPAPVDSGITFSVQTGNGSRFLRPDPALVVDTRLCTTLGNGEWSLGTVEHLLAAIRGLGIDNILVEVHGREIPIMDGSSASFVYLLRQAGVRVQEAGKKVMALTREFSVQDNNRWIKGRPARGLSVTCTIDFPHPMIGRQMLSLDCTPQEFIRTVSRARTFGFLHEVESLQAHNLALGGSLDNAVVLDDYGVVNPEGFRFPDEPVRHKLLDFLGDLGLMPYPVWGRFEVHCSGHSLNNAFAKALAENRTSLLEMIELKKDPGSELLGHGAVPDFATST
jgi:UDP-3-O-[3-hydroxymyristoyl] N-acetylglucosamine deacetylase